MIAQSPSPSKSSQAPVPSSRRPIPLRGRKDLCVQQIAFRGTPWWVIKDPVGLKYHRLPAHQYCVLNLLDGERSLKEIRDELSKQFPARFMQLSEVQRMITSLHQQGLLWNERPGQTASLINQQRKLRSQKVRQAFKSLLSMRLPGWDPDSVLQVMDRWLGWIYHPAVLSLAGALIVASWFLILVQFDEFRSRLPEFQQFFSWQNLFWLWVTLGATKVLHEFGHGLTCRHFGSECHEMGVMILIFSPTLYCDVTDSWMLRDKWQRIWIAAAGMGIEIFLSSVAIITWWFTTPGLLNHLCLNVFFVTTATTVLFNANPLLRYDGYYMLSDWLGVPNLRERATSVLRDLFAWCLGITRPRDPLIPEGSTFWFAAYGIAANLYSWMVLSAILMFIYSTLKPYGLQNIGLTFAALTITGIVSSLVMTTYRILAAPRSEPLNSTRAAFTISLLAVVTMAALAFPLPWWIESPCLVEPHNVENVVTSVPGELVEFAVRPGDTVERGQVLVRLRDFKREDELRALKISRQSQLAEISMLHALEQFSDHHLAVKRLESIDVQLQELESQLNELTIVAPISGRVVAAPPVPPPPEGARRRLHEWEGKISDPKNLGCFVQSRTHLLSIAPDSMMQVVLYLDQAHRDDLDVDQEVQIKFEHQPGRTYTARVTDIAREHSEVAPPTLSAKHGGVLPSVTDETGQERLTSVAYRARVVLETETDLLKSGMRGTARFLVETHSAAGWIWRSFRRTIHFRL